MTEDQKEVNRFASEAVAKAITKSRKQQKDFFLYQIEFVRKEDYGKDDAVKNEVLDEVLANINDDYTEDDRFD